jgi:hypothetical protein
MLATLVVPRAAGPTAAGPGPLRKACSTAILRRYGGPTGGLRGGLRGAYGGPTGGLRGAYGGPTGGLRGACDARVL